MHKLTKLEQKFNNDMVRIYNEASKLGYRPTRFLNMIYRFGGVKTAKKLLSKEYLSEGLKKLWELGRLDLSVESLVLKQEYKRFFTLKELDIAEKNLKKLNQNLSKN